jgi:hypothetical protein
MTSCAICGQAKPDSAYYPILPNRDRKIAPSDIEYLPKCIECIDEHERNIVKEAVTASRAWLIKSREPKI